MTSRRSSHRASAKTRSSSWSCAPPSGRRRGSTRPRWEPWTRPRVTHMRLEILNNGYGLGAKVLFAMIRVFSGQPMPDAARLVFYRPEFYGTPMKEVTHEAMRGPSQWSVGDRELMAAFVSKANECVFCIGAHTAAAAGAYHDRAKVAAVLADLETAPVDERL